MKILIVDDHFQIRQVIRTIICQTFAEQMELHEIIETDNGLAAVELVQTSKPDLILLDYQLNDINGFEVIRRIVDHGVTASIVLITGFKSELLKKQAFELGVLAYMEKENLFLLSEFIQNYLFTSQKINI